MTNDIFTKKTPLVLAVGAALSLGVQTAWAEDGEDTPKDPYELTIGSGEGQLKSEISEGTVTIPGDFTGKWTADEEPGAVAWEDGDDINIKAGSDETDPKTIKISGGTLSITNAAGSVQFNEGITSIDITSGEFSNASDLYLVSANLNVSGGSFSNARGATITIGQDRDGKAPPPRVDDHAVTVSGTAGFVNNGKIVLADGVAFNVEFKSPTSSQVGDGEDVEAYTPGSFNNSGDYASITVGTGTFKIASSAVMEGEKGSQTEVVYDEAPDDLPVLKMGDIIVNGGTIKNENTGYLVKGESEDSESDSETGDGDGDGDSGATQEPEPVRHTLVDFDDVTLNNGTFTSATGARETGDKLTLNGTEASASFAGYSEWDSIVLNLAALEDEEATQEEPSDSAKSITVNADGVLKIGKITLENLTSGSDPLSLSNYVEAKSGDDGQGTKAGSVTVTDKIAVSELRGDSAGTFEVDAGALKTANIDVSGAALSISNSINYATDKRQHFTWEELQKNETEDSGNEGAAEMSEAPSDTNLFEAVEAGDVATLKVTGYKATWKEPESSESDGDSGDGDSGDSSTATGAWETASIGSISVGGTSQLEITGLRTGTDAVDSNATVKPKEDAVYTASVSSISLSENWYTATAEVDTDSLKPDDEDDEDVTDDGWKTSKYESVVNELKGFIAANGKGENKLTKLDSKITGSDLDIDSLSIAKTVTDIDLDDYEVVVEEGDKENGDKWEIKDGATKTSITTDAVQHTAVTLEITDSRLRIGKFTQETGTLTIGGETTSGQVSEVVIDSVSKMDGEFTFNGGLLALNANSIDRDELLGFFGKEDGGEGVAALTKDDKLLYIGSTVTFGENARVGFGTSAPTGETLADDDEADDAAQTGSKVVIDAGTTIAFNARVFNSNGLLAGTGDGATLVFNVDPNAVDGKKIKLVSENTSVGAFNLTQGFTIVHKNDNVLDGDEATGEILNYFDASGVSIDAAWGLTGDNLVYVNDKGQIIIGDTNEDGKVTTADFSLLSDVAAKGLVDDVLAGNRTNETADRYLINRLLMNVHQKKDDSDTIADYSVSEAVREINSMTQFAAVSALKAMTVDFSGYVQDQIEHHAYTIPHEMRGWWVQPIGARLKTDDLRAGNLTTGYSLDTYGIMGGYDWTVPNGDIWGIAASYQSGDADGEGNALAMTSDVSATSFHIWAARHIGDLRVMGAFTYMKSDDDATMSTSLGSLSSDELAATAVSFGMRADLTKTYGNFKLVPHAGARVSMVDMDDFTVTYQNTYEAFKYSEDKAWIFEVPVGVTAATSFEYQRWNVQPYVDLTVRGRFGDTDATTTVTGVGSGVSDKVKYDVSGDVIGDLRVGYMSTFQNLNLGMSYGFSAGDAGRQNHTFEATLRIDL